MRRLSKQTRANRRNAARSTGPKTKTGKARSAQNALKHGLSVPITSTLESAGEIAALALAMSSNADELSRQLALKVAEPQIDLDRIRRVRREIWRNVTQEMEKGAEVTGDRSARLSVCRDLDRVERYENRALARRKAAVRDFKKACRHQSQPRDVD